MISTSEAYRSAVTAPVRRTHVRVPLRLVSPDAAFGAVTGSPEAPMSDTAELTEGGALGAVYATLEPGLWALDGATPILPDTYETSPPAGWVSAALSGEDGAFALPQTVTLAVSGISLLQAVTLEFPGGAAGVAADLTVTVRQGGTDYFTRTLTGNTEKILRLTGFTVYTPDQVTVTVTRWSLPWRRMRVYTLFPGLSVTWTEDDLTALTVEMRAAVGAMTQPYGSASLTIDNAARLFDPRNKAGLFQSLEDRQSIPIQLGVELPDGTTEYLPCGVWYRQGRAWTVEDGGGAIRWDLVDIIGLLSERAFVSPSVLPQTLEGWVSALTAQLGEAFRNRYTVDPFYADKAVTAREDPGGKPCGDILKWLCQCTGTFARADAETGNLTVEPLWDQGNAYTLDNLEDFPTVSANDNLSALLFHLDTDLLVSGNTAASANTASVDNLFVSNQTEALSAARNILTAYGGNRLSMTGRGDPSSEVGDVATVELGDGEAAAARIIGQTFTYRDGVLRSCKTELLQADGARLYQNREALTEDTVWTAPAGITELDVILVGGGAAGGHGTYGTSMAWPTRGSGWYSGTAGKRGEPGPGGSVWYATLAINPEQSFSVRIGQGGVSGTGAEPVPGTATTFGSCTSAAGRTYTPSFTDAFSGSAYGRSGVYAPAPGSGDGGIGGAGGAAGAEYWADDGTGTYTFVAARAGGAGRPGAAGGSGCAILYYDRKEG